MTRLRTLTRLHALALGLLLAAVTGGLVTPGCSTPAHAGKLEVTYYYLPG